MWQWGGGGSLLGESVVLEWDIFVQCSGWKRAPFMARLCISARLSHLLLGNEPTQFQADRSSHINSYDSMANISKAQGDVCENLGHP